LTSPVSKGLCGRTTSPSSTESLLRGNGPTAPQKDGAPSITRDGLSWRDMEVDNDTQGKPELILAGRAEELFRNSRLSRIFLSLSHDGNYAIASVILEGK
jgi:hypothetical protein